jgi:16S rRNA (uracil1498-N3)-methyltransferase
VVRDAVMMGVTSIVPLLAARSEVSAATLQRRRSRERWQRIAIVSAKQCGRAVVPAIEEPCDLDALLSRVTSEEQRPIVMFVEPAAAGHGSSGAVDAHPSTSATVIIGPEGGWTPEELARTVPGISHVTLPGPTLRADAMAVVALTMLFTNWREF